MSLPTCTSDRAADRPTAVDPPLTSEAALDLVAADFAARAGALADLLQSWRCLARARVVVASLLARDEETFEELLRDFDPPLLGKRPWLHGIVERIVGDVELRSVYRLRTNLTAGERALFLQLVQQFRHVGALSLAARDASGRSPAIVAGPFLDALRAEGLVTCVDEPVERAGLQQVLAKPTQMCA